MSYISHQTKHEDQVFEESSTFDVNYGDFTLISSDSVRFHINRSLLGYVSGFFRDLFSLPVVNSSKVESGEDSLAVKEPSPILDAFLRHVDPNKTSPGFDATTIAPLLESARFYRVPSIITWFKIEVLVRRTIFRSKVDGPCFLEEHPLLVLALAYKFGLSELTQMAMSQLITCDATLWKKDVDGGIDGRLVLYAKQLRDERVELYSSLVQSLTQYELSNTGNIKDATQDMCMSCTVSRSEWTHTMLHSAMLRPEWCIFLYTYNRAGASPNCTHNVLWSDVKRKSFTKWRNINQPEKLEEKMPFVPLWLEDQMRDNASLVPESTDM